MDKRLTTYSNDNRVINQIPLSGILEYEMIYGLWTKDSYTGQVLQSWTKMRKYTLRYVCEYSYVGMTKQTALNCANALKDSWKGSMYYWVWDNINGLWVKKTGPQVCIADIQVQKGSGTMWDVVVSIDYTMVGYSKPSDPMYATDFPSVMRKSIPSISGE